MANANNNDCFHYKLHIDTKEFYPIQLKVDGGRTILDRDRSVKNVAIKKVEFWFHEIAQNNQLLTIILLY